MCKWCIYIDFIKKLKNQGMKNSAKQLKKSLEMIYGK